MKKAVLLAGLTTLMTTAAFAAEMKILALAGSTRKDSYNKMLVQEAAKMAQQMGAKVKVIELNDYQMPFYDADYEKNEKMPKAAKQLRKLMIESDGIIIASPEYNASIPAVLKNSLDWASRGEDGNPSRDAFKGKRFAIMSASPGPGGGARALKHLRAIIENAGGTVVEQEVTIPKAHEYFAQKDRPENPLLKKELQELLSAKPATN